ncbi:MAG: type II secretion system protein [Planctomycetota bacterium]
MKRRKSGLTLVELLTVLAIMALLVGLLVPALTVVRNIARETKQKAQFATIELALTTFKNDYGDYPPSDPHSWLADTVEAKNYCGAQRLAEALLGWDLLGFHPDSGWRSDGTNRWAYKDPVDPSILHPPGQYFLYNPNSVTDMDKRKGRYLELATTNAFRIGITAQHDGLFDFGKVNSLLASAPDTFVICDVFGKEKITLANGKSVKAGVPILYYRAYTSGKTINAIYDMDHNDALVYTKEQVDQIQRGPVPQGQLTHNPLAGTVGFFERYIADPKVTARPWPYRPDSYILISAGADGLYGTSDDIRNFGN